MALFDSYAQPGVYTTEIVANPGTVLQTGLRIPVFIGEGSETSLVENYELHRGSSASSDDAVVNENISDQVDGTSHTFKLTYFPVVIGDGNGTVTNNVSYVQVFNNGVPAIVSSLNGATGEVVLQLTPSAGDQLSATYYFKRKDTQFTDNLTDQIPFFASLVIPPQTTTTGTLSPLTLTVSQPGYLGNTISFGISVAADGYGVDDINAISGSGSNFIQIEAKKVNNSIRTWEDIGTLITLQGGIPTADSGLLEVGVLTTATKGTPAYVTPTSATIHAGAFIIGVAYKIVAIGDTNFTLIGASANPVVGELFVATGVGAGTGTATVLSSLLSGGLGPTSNTIFKVNHVPIVDGSNGGVVTNNPSHLSAYVGGSQVVISGVDGLHGLVTLSTPVPAGKSLDITYFTNTYQDTFDLLPASNISSINTVGFGPNRSDFINGMDYVLETQSDANGNIVSTRIQWGNSVSTNNSKVTAGYTPFNAAVVETTLVDEKMFLRACSSPLNAVPGLNTTFILPDSPTDGSGQNKGLGPATDDPSLIQVYVGSGTGDAALHSALLAPPQVVTRLSGATNTFQLLAPPAAGDSVFATYTRNTLQESTYTLTVDAPGITGVGTYFITDTYGNEFPSFAYDETSSVVADANFYTTGPVWPFGYSDMSGVPQAVGEGQLALTFITDTTAPIVYGGSSSSASIHQGGSVLTFSAADPGVLGNLITINFFAGAPTANPVIVNGGDISVNIIKPDSSTLTLSELAALFNPFVDVTVVSGPLPPYGPTHVTCSGTGTSSSNTVVPTPTPVPFSGGTDAITIHASQTFEVNYTPVGSSIPVGLGTGLLNQTFISETTGIKFTLINPDDAVILGCYTTAPSPSYNFSIGDILTFNVSSSSFVTSAQPQITIPGLWVTVNTTYGMNGTTTNGTTTVAGDSVIISTHNRAGSEPSVGDYYYVTYSTQKTATDMALTIFTNPQDAYAQYGEPTPVNRLSLAASLFTQNGGQIFGCIQVPKVPGTDFASSNSYQTAIASLARPLPGSDQKADMIQVMTTNPSVIQYLNRFLITQAAPRNSGEATSVYGYAFSDTPDTMRSLSNSIRSDRMVGVGVPGAILSVTTNGSTVQYAVDGSFLAAGIAGMVLNPAIDVATTLTRQSLTGFDSLITRYDDPTLDLMASSGLTCLVERNGAFAIRHWVTTDNTSVLKREPTSRLIIDLVRKTVRNNLEQFIGRKLVQSALNAVAIVANATLRNLMEREIIDTYANLQITADASDPTLLHVSFSVKPIFSILYVDVKITVTTQI